MASMNEIRVRIGLARKIYAITNSSQKVISRDTPS